MYAGSGRYRYSCVYARVPVLGNQHILHLYVHRHPQVRHAVLACYFLPRMLVNQMAVGVLATKPVSLFRWLHADNQHGDVTTVLTQTMPFIPKAPQVCFSLLHRMLSLSNTSLICLAQESLRISFVHDMF